jgi:hypothetical protein
MVDGNNVQVQPAFIEVMLMRGFRFRGFDKRGY